MKTLKKLNLTQIIRRLIQFISFILLPGLFISIFSAIKDVYTALISGSFSFNALSYQLLLLLAVIPFTVLFGRFFCGFLCAFGAMGDLLWFIAGKVHKRRVFISKRADSILKATKYVLLAAIVMMIWTLGIGSFGSTASPWTIFGMYFTLAGWPSAAYLISIGTVLLLFIILGSLFIERFFCRYLCPLGAFFSIISRPRLFRIKKPRRDCGACSLCTSECAMGIRLNETDQISSGECINCFKCVKVCPRQNVRVNPTPAVATSMAAAAMAGLYFVGTVSGCNSASAQSTITASAVDAAAFDAAAFDAAARASDGTYTDGTYTGSASGFRGTTTVQVTVEDGVISDVNVLSTNDDSQYFSRAENSIISNLLLSQSTDVPTVSGATFSSNAIINAVKNALSSSDSDFTAESAQTPVTAAGKQDTVSEAAQETTDSQTMPNTSATAETAEAAFPDGIYTGAGSGYRGNTTVTVTVSGGVISDISVVSSYDDERFINRAESSVISSIISKQSINVSTVSGATFSSNGIIEAVANALSIEFSNPNSTLPKHVH